MCLATTAYTFSTSQLPKVRWSWCALYILTWKCASRHNGIHFFDSSAWKVARNRQFLTLLTWKCASRHNGVHLFDISTSTSGPYVWCFVNFDLEMCFAPQGRTMAYTFSTSQLPKVRWTWCALYILTWKCASRHNGVHFFDSSTWKSGSKPPVFSTFDLEMCFAPDCTFSYFFDISTWSILKWSENGVLCTFWLGNVLRATTACTFSSLLWPAGSAPAA